MKIHINRNKKDPHAHIPWEAFDSEHPDHDYWFECTNKCLDKECERHECA